MNDVLNKRRLTSLRAAMEPIGELMEKDSVQEIMLNEDGRVWVDEVGRGMYSCGIAMAPEAAERMIRLIAACMDSEVNENNPSLSAKLPGRGARVQATMPPIVEAPIFSIRKPSRFVFPLSNYITRGIMSAEQSVLIMKAVSDRKNILIGGGTFSGKTTLANTILSVVSDTKDRLYIVEDNPELQCKAENAVKILLRPPVYDCRRAIMDALRYRPDRIIVGEVRDGSALDLLKAWNTGHPGGIATIHANNPMAMLDRMCQLIEEVVPAAPRELVADAVDVCIHIKRDPGHEEGRRISGIVQVNGLDETGGWKLEPC